MAPTSASPQTDPPSRYVTSTHVFFYGHELTTPESYLQMWYPAVIVEPSPTDPRGPPNRFPTCEHHMTYHKAVIMGDLESASRILLAATPREANKLGRGVSGYKPDLWKVEREKIAEQGNWLKFSQVAECRKALLETGQKTLVEASPSDRLWGIGFRGDEAEGREQDWGENILGKALMRVRARLRKDGHEAKNE